MKINRKFSIILLLGITISVMASATISKSTEDTPQYVNLKVLPKNINSKDLQKIMVDDFEDGLGVACNFCHAADKTNGQLDFASDAKPEKNMARNMYKMAAKINNKYFEGKKDSLGMVIGDIKCITCHHGSPHPDEAKGMDMDHDHDMKGPGNGQQAPPPPPAPPAGN